MTKSATLLVLILGLFLGRPVRAFDAASLSEVGLGLGGIAYWSHPVFANDLWNGSQWLEYGSGQWGSTVYLENNPQFDANGFPKYLKPGLRLRAVLFSLHANPAPRPAAWPDRTRLARGKVVISWKGDADIRADGGTYLSAESSGASTGRLVNGRRVYRYSGASHLQWFTLEDINASNPVTDIKVWLPDPANPSGASLEGQFFHPTYLARIADAPWAFLRFMDWGQCNASPQRDWTDRRPPTQIFMDGVLNRRSPAIGFGGDRGTGVAFEHTVALCNTAGRDMWINVPHLATDDFVRRLAQVIRYGSDGLNPYSDTVTSPAYAPLAAGRRVFVELSNEIWSNGNAFPQGNWAQEQATALGITKEQFNARRFCQIWSIFEEVFAGQTERLVRVAAVWTGQETYTRNFLNEVAVYGASLTPPQRPDVIAPTTYFGNGIQDWAYAKARAQAGTSDQWFFTSATYTNGTTVKPVSVSSTASYWTSTNVARHLTETFTEWRRRLLGESSQSGGGPDATGIGGGFDYGLRNVVSNAFGSVLPIVSYEGGPSIYTDYLDWGDDRDAGITTFMEMVNRHPAFRDLYRIHLNLAKAKGLRTHGAFVDIGAWGRYGQWGHLEYAGQDPATAVKWDFITHWPAEMASLRHVDSPLGAVPVFLTAARLPSSIWGQPYSQEIQVSGGNGALAIDIIDMLLVPGLTVSNSGTRLTIAGTPSAPGENFLLARVRDADGDPAWRTFWFRTLGGPGTLLECSFEGTNPTQRLPWTQTYQLKPELAFSGWIKGGGINAASGNDALIWAQNMPSDESASTLALALADAEHWRFTLTPAQPLDLRNAEVRFTIRRIDYHAPRRYALFTSISGFAAGAEIFDSGHFTDETDREFVARLPDTAAYSNVTGVLEFRLVGYAGQWGGHKTSLRAFKISQALRNYDLWIAGFPTLSGAASLRGADPDADRLPNLVEYALGLDPTTFSAPVVIGGLLRSNQYDFLHLTYPQKTGGSGTVGIDYTAGGVKYTIESSPRISPADWQTGAGLLEFVGPAIPSSNGTEQVTVRLESPTQPGQQSYLRLKLTEQ